MVQVRRVFEHFRFIVAHPAYRGVATWFRYIRWTIAVVTRRTALCKLTPFSARVVVPPDLRGVARLLYLFGGALEPELPLLVRLVGPGDTAVDVGAHYGSHTAALAELVGPSGRVIAFEPLPIAFRILERTVAANGFENVETYQVAAGETLGSAKLLMNADPSRTRIDLDGDGVRVVTLDSLALDDVRFVKIDTEGHEDAVLAGATATLAKQPIVMLEVSPGSCALETLRSAGYLVFKVENDRLVKVETATDGVSNYVCIHRNARSEVSQEEQRCSADGSDRRDP